MLKYKRNKFFELRMRETQIALIDVNNQDITVLAFNKKLHHSLFIKL